MIWKHRYVVLAILFGAQLLCYLDRMVMATATPFIAQDLQLSPLGMGQVSSAFFVGYALNTAGQVAGVISPLLVGYVLEVTGGNFQIVLFGMVGLALLAILPASRIRHASQPLVTASSAT